MRIRNDNLCLLLKKTKRTQTLDGKKQDQVTSCVLRPSGPSFKELNTVTTTCLVRDGLSSLSRFSTEYESWKDRHTGSCLIVTDIDRLLGVLKYHGQMVTLTQTEDKLKITSSGKQTTIDASPEARINPSNQATILEWEQNSRSLAETKLDVPNNLYRLEGGGSKTAFAWYVVDANDLYEAFRCDSMNGQKKNEYQFEGTEDGNDLYVSTGLDLKGTTRTLISHEKGMTGHFFVTIKGGMEQLFANLNGNVTVKFFDFHHEGQGIKVLFDLGNGDYVFQSGILKR